MVAEKHDALQVLIVEDEPDNANTLADVLRTRGYNTDVCLHAPDGMEVVERLHPDVLILDLAMPGMTGFDIAQECQDNPDLRPRLLIAVTGCTDDEFRTRSQQAGFDYYFVKPVDPALLIALLSGLADAAGERTV